MKKLLLLFSFLISINAFSQKADSLASKNHVDSTNVYYNLDTLPVFPGGFNALEEFIRKYLPDTIFYGYLNVLFSITVDTSGIASGPGYEYSVGGIPDRIVFSKRVDTLMKYMPRWTPGIHNGHAVKSRFLLPIFKIMAHRGVVLDSASLHKTRAQYLDEINGIFRRWSVGYHSPFYQDALEAMNDKNYKKAIREFDKSIVGLKYDMDAWALRAMAYFAAGVHSEDTNSTRFGCSDLRFISYLNEFEDSSLIIDPGLSLCAADYFFNRESFLSGGMVVPNKIHGSNYKEETLDSEPQFPGGTDSLYSYLASHFKMEKNVHYENYKSRLLVRFTVSKDGEIENPIVMSNAPAILSREAARLAMGMPKWKPAMKNGKPVAVEYLFPIINFKYRQKEYLKAYIEELNSDYNQGVAFFGESRFPEAITAFNKAIEKNPYDLDAYYNRGIAYFKMRDKDKACADWGFGTYNYDDASRSLIDKFCDSLVIYKGDTLYSYSFVPDKGAGKISSKTYPVYPGGWDEMRKFISAHLVRPKEYGFYSGTVYVKCLITRSGEVRSPKVISYCEKQIADAALKVISTLPNFIPATKNDIPIDVYYTLAVSFKQ